MKLQGLKDHAAFQAVGSARLLGAIGAVLETRAWETPRRWGAIFVAFPTAREWGVPAGGWHIDANYRSRLWPPGGVQTHALFGDIAPRGGGSLILSGSHRLIHRWFADHPPPAGARSPDLRRTLLGIRISGTCMPPAIGRGASRGSWGARRGWTASRCGWWRISARRGMLCCCIR